MCGFAGFVDFNEPYSTREDLIKMQKSILHRGPDDAGYFYSPGIGLCHARLSILDLSQKAHQPMRRGFLTLVYNGEIFNYRELCRELEKLGHAFESKSDTEVVLAAYQQWGDRALERFNGMFALAIYDEENKKIFLARDKRGIKPLYYYCDENHFIFASEIKAIQKSPHFKKNISLPAVGDYLHFGYINGNQTVWEHTRKLLPGQYMVVNIKRRTLEVHDYGNSYFTQDLEGNFEEIKDKLKSVLVDEFRQSMISDVPVGVCISGGVDSNVLVSLLTKELGVKLRTYSLSSPQSQFDENVQAGRIARYLGTDHTSLVMEPESCRNLFLETIAHYDEPIADQNIISYRYIAQRAKKDGVSVLLSGVGGDELFLGYPWTILMAKLQPFFCMPHAMRKMIPRSLCGFSNYLYKGVHIFQQENYSSALSSITGNCFFKDEVNALMPQNRYVDNYFDSVLRDHYPKKTTFLEKIMRCHLLCYLPANILQIADMSTMAEGVEMRVPYLNNAIVDFALKIPSRLKMHNGKSKAFLRAIEGEYLPHEFLTEAKRGFYPFVKSVWLKNEFKDLFKHYLSESKIRKQSIFDYRVLEKIVSLENKSNVKTDNKIWNMLVFQIWADSHLYN